MDQNNDTWVKRFNAYGALFVTVVVLSLFGTGLVFSYWAKTEPSQTFNSLMEIIKTLAVLVVGYWVGSSNSSQKKDDTTDKALSALATSAPVMPLVPPGTKTVVTTPETTTTVVQPEIKVE